MIIRLSRGQHQLLEREDYGRLKLRVPAGWSADEIARGLPFTATCTAEHVWIPEADLRALLLPPRGASAEPGSTAPDPISAMIDKAKKYGFYDDAIRAIRVHIEYD